MPRIRSVHPEICTDETLVNVTARAERTFVRLWTQLDDEGRTRDNPKLLKASLYPLHDDITAAHVDADLDELESHDLIIRYAVGGQRYLTAKPESWRALQKPRHPSPSKYPDPPEDDGRPTADRREATALVGVGVGVGDGGVVAEHPPTTRATRAPAKFALTEGMRAWAKSKGITIDLTEETERFLDHHRSKGNTFKDWTAAWRKWMGKAQEYAGPTRNVQGQIAADGENYA